MPTVPGPSISWVQAVHQISILLPALVLLPEGGLFDRLIAALEEAQTESTLTGDEEFLLKRLRRLKTELESMDWRDQAAWSKVHRHIEHLNDADVTLAMAATQSGGKLH